MYFILALCIWALAIGGYVQHVVSTWAADQVVLFLIGFFVPPIGMVHGWLIWLGIA